MDNRIPRNTAKDDPGLSLASALQHGASESIERMEAEGQRQIVASEMLPTEILGATKADFEALGFVFGDPVTGDELFQAATLPQEWSREGSEHTMWSYVVDETGKQRVAIFYKAAFYDRRAHMSIVANRSDDASY